MAWVFAVILLATFVHSVAGFGLALVAMPLLVALIGIEQAAPLVSLIGISAIVILTLRYRAQVEWRAIRGLAIGSVIGIPLGVLALRAVSETVVVFLLGAFLVGYAGYAWLSPQLPALRHPGWGYGFGFVGGLISGAYNSGGPPLVVFGNCQRWEPQEFKGNLQILLLLHSVAVTLAHMLDGNYTRNVFEFFAISVPALVLGTGMGYSLDRYINRRLFHRLVLVLLVILGARLIQSALM